MNDHLNPNTRMGRLELRVRDMASQFAFYTEGVGLEPLAEEPRGITLGLDGVPIVQLSPAPGLRPAPPGEAGLFHTAVVFDERPALARAVSSLLHRYPRHFAGTGDHLVSEAFYFSDPEGNGVELYHDRPRSGWRWIGNQVQMATLPLDPMEYLRSHLAGLDPGSIHPTGTLGHVHLQVGDVESARRFYVDALGFDETCVIPGQALFVSAGGYHHHMAMNVWNSAGAGARRSTLGLGVVDIHVPDGEELSRTRHRLAEAGLETQFDGRTLGVHDPWRNELRLSVA